MTGDREAALRDLFTAIRDALTVPDAASPADTHLAWEHAYFRAGAVRAALTALIDGPLDHVAVHRAAQVLPMVAADLPPGYEMASPAAQAAGLVCGRCGGPVARPTDVQPDGKPALGAQFCDPCLDRCHDATEFDHICQVCASPEEARRRGWAVTR